MKRKCLMFVTSSLMGVLLACLTINVYFPAAAVEQAADKFVEDVQKGAVSVEPKPTPTAKKETSWLLIGVAHADEPNINIATPEANRIKTAMQSRVGDLNAIKAKGAVGETKDGMLTEKDFAALPLPERAKAKQVLEAENKDRRDLYNEVVNANHYPKDKMSEIQSIFAKSWQKASPVGTWIQNPDGAWVKM